MCLFFAQYCKAAAARITKLDIEMCIETDLFRGQKVKVTSHNNSVVFALL